VYNPRELSYLAPKLDRMLSILECRSSPPTRKTPNLNPNPPSLQHRPLASVFPSQLLSRGWSTSKLEREELDLPLTLSINRSLPLFTADSLIQLPPLLGHYPSLLHKLLAHLYHPNRKLHPLNLPRTKEEENQSLNSPSRLPRNDMLTLFHLQPPILRVRMNLRMIWNGK